MRYRPQRGSLSDSLLASKDIAWTMTALAEAVSEQLNKPITKSDLVVSLYGYDPRIMSNVYAVHIFDTIASCEFVGFIDVDENQVLDKLSFTGV